LGCPAYRLAADGGEVVRSLYQRRANCELMLLEQVMAQHVVEADLPGIVVATDIDALDELHLICPSILHIDIDVQNEVADFLDGAPSGPVSPSSNGKVALANGYGLRSVKSINFC
jgi:hypothetical protein